MEPDFKNPEEVLQHIGNLDTARMTLRWSLERIRSLERGLSDAQISLAEAVAARERALSDSQDTRKEFEKRARTLEEKERFVSEMQSMLNNLFRGEVQIADIIRLKEDLEKERTQLESQVRGRIKQAEDLARKTELENGERLAEIEATYAGALSEAQKRFQGKIEEVRRAHEKDLQAEREKFDRFREESLQDARVLEEHYHRKLLELEKDFAERRVGLQKDFETLKEKIVQEQREISNRREAALKRDLADKDAGTARLEQALSELEARHHENRIGQAKAVREKLESLQKELREEKEAQLAALRAEHEKRTAEYVEELGAARGELRQREKAFQDERLRLLAERDRLRDESLGGLTLRLAQREEQFKLREDHLLREHQERITAQNARHEEELASLRRNLESAYNDGWKLDREQAEEDLEAMRKFYDAMLAKEKIESQRALDAASGETESLKKRLAREISQKDTAHAAELDAQRKRTAEEISSLQARGKETSALSRLQAETSAKEEAAKRQALEAAHAACLSRAEVRIAELLRLRDQETEKYRAQREELQKAYETIAQEREARTRQQDIRELEAVRQHFQKLLEERRRDYEAHAGKLGEEVSRLRNLLDEQERDADAAKRSLRELHAAELETIRKTRTPAWATALKAAVDILLGPKALAAALCATAVAGGLLWRLAAPPGKDYTVSFSHATSLVWRGDELWVSDWYDQSLHRLRPGPKGLEADGRFNVPRSRLTGMTFVGDKIFVADSLNKEIQRWRLEKDRLVHEASWPSPGDSPSALHFDGKSLWSADLTSRRIYQHVLDDALTILTAYPTERAPVALYAETDRFWSADSDSRIVFRHRFDDSLTPVAAYHLPELQDGKTPLSAFTLRKGRLWIARDGSNRLLERPIESFQREALGSSSAKPAAPIDTPASIH